MTVGMDNNQGCHFLIFNRRDILLNDWDGKWDRKWDGKWYWKWDGKWDGKYDGDCFIF